MHCLDADRAAGATIGHGPRLVGGARLDKRRDEERRKPVHVVEAERHVERGDAGLEERPQKDPDDADERDTGEGPLRDIHIPCARCFLARRVENRVGEEPDLEREDDERGPHRNRRREPPLGLHDLVGENRPGPRSHRPGEDDEKREKGHRNARSLGRPRLPPCRSCG